MKVPVPESADEPHPRPGAADGGTDTGTAARDEAARRRLLDEIFGDVLPRTTGDERDPADRAPPDADRWYSENRPPHHG